MQPRRKLRHRMNNADNARIVLEPQEIDRTANTNLVIKVLIEVHPADNRSIREGEFSIFRSGIPDINKVINITGGEVFSKGAEKQSADQQG